MSDTVTLYATTETQEEALAIARRLVEERLVACANILPRGRSVYRWEGAVVDEGETYMLLKTRADLADRAVARLSELHSYEVPCVAVWPWSGGEKAYCDWVADEIREAT